MALTVNRYSGHLQDRWDAFVWKANNGTLFHTRRFLGYHPAGRFEDHSLVFLEENATLALFPAALRTVEGRRVLSSHAGSSYGGFVYPENLSVRSAFDLVSALIEHCRAEGIEAIDMTLPPVIYHQRPSHYLDFALYKNGFTYRKREISSVIPLDFPVGCILDQFKPEARTAYRKSVKSGVTIRESDDFASFYPILKKNLNLRHNVSPTHTLEEIVRLKGLFPDRIRLIGAFLSDVMTAGVVNFLCNDRVVLAFYISHDEAYQEVRPVNHLFYEIIKWSIENGYRFLDYGIFTVNEDPNWGLGKFKESFGARGIFRDTFMRIL
jgi:hypothetical protein